MAKSFLSLLFLMTFSFSMGISQEKSGSVFSIEGGPLLGGTASVNNIIFVPGFEFRAAHSFYSREKIAIAAGSGYKQFRRLNGVPAFLSFHVFLPEKKPGVQPHFYGLTGYSYVWDNFAFQTQEKVKGGFLGEIGWGKRVDIGSHLFCSFDVGYQVQQYIYRFSTVGESSRKESVFYHLVSLKIGIGKK